jgi:hypothetical protein
LGDSREGRCCPDGCRRLVLHLVGSSTNATYFNELDGYDYIKLLQRDFA